MTGFREFCGNSSIFDEDLLLNNTWPEFTPCFQDSLLVWIPCGWVWVTLPVYLVFLCNYSNGIVIPVNKLNVSKTLLSFVLAILTVVATIKAEPNPRRDTDSVAEIVYWSGGIKVATYLLVAVLIQLERARGVITSGVLFLFWLFSSVANVIPLYTKLYLKEYEDQEFTTVIFFIYFATLLLQFVLSSFAEKIGRDGYETLGPKMSPEVSASFPSRLTFWWMNRTVFTAYRRTLQEDDMFELHPRDKGHRVVPQFGNAWADELHQARKKMLEKKRLERIQSGMGVASFYRNGTRNGAPSVQTNERTPLINGSTSNYSSNSKEGSSADVSFKIPGQSEGSSSATEVKKDELPASLFKVLVKTYGLELLQAHFCKLIYDLLQFVSPILLGVLIDYTNDREKVKEQGQQWKGYVYASSFFVVSSIGSIMFNQNFHIGMSLGMRIKAALIAAVYKKSLTVSNESKKETTVGEIVNLMAVDCQRMQDVTGYLWMLWSAPLQISLALYLLWGTLGVATLAGLAVMLLLMPLNGLIAAKMRKFQIQQMKFKDQRIKLMTEVLNGIKVLKLYAWEPSFQEKVEEIRRQELKVLRNTAYLNACSTFFWTCAPFFVTLATFATYVLVSEDHYLDANKAFVALSLFNILRFPINLLPMLASFVVQASVSVKRIGKFLRQDDLDPTSVNYDPDSEAAISISRGVFTWDKTNPTPTLSDIKVKIQEGKLVAVVGQVGAGKSSLISAMLGEMEKLKGTVTVKSSIAYVPQQAWIQNATLRDNVLFGSDYNERMYEKVIEGCALTSDLDILPGGDMTEIGEKGINLSGGQKQRVSLARAVYNDADIYLLDDPLSAVDSHVGKHIFDKIISHKGMLKRKTRILVTHGVHWLPQVDHILVMTNGKISESGSYEELLSHDGPFAQFLKQYLTQEEDEDEEEDPERQIPTDLSKSIFIALPKKPGATECELHRTISLMSHITKILLKIIMLRIRNKIKPEIAEEQCGFVEDKGTSNAIYILRTLIERALEVQKDVYLCFIDYTKAFDRVQHDEIITQLKQLNIGGKDLRIIKTMYWEQTSAMRIENKTSTFQDIKRGVRQGCILSPDLFSLYSEVIMRNLENHPGIKVGGQNINNFRYASKYR
ncbi:multidrug resistance-associated protein 1 [Plakobranchus ocellatus]|uniref:ABC-type glutathione-S-conjugate transporter n=1 Tax=Plakobranchus ocellatus TaxID=259542 RepID=A0AAV3ZXP3_9GAST|nr:multidrug resistance-associated protein 1 [Plakobranchus ocellatus]